MSIKLYLLSHRVSRAAVLVLSMSCLTVIPQSLAADTVQTLSWEALLAPERKQLMDSATALRKQFVQLPKSDQRYYLAVTQALEVRARVDAGSVTVNDLEDWEMELLESEIIDQHPEVEALWTAQTELEEKMQAAGGSVAQQLNGKSVKLPGYVLPIDPTANPIQKFLFVPDLSVFVHPPAPPANQVIHVTFEKGVTLDEIKKLVWVEGVITTTGGQHIVSYDDEDRPVDVAYSMTARRTLPYQP